MGAFRRGTVARVLASSAAAIEVEVETGSGRITAMGFPSMLGPLGEGDEVVVNTLGIDLGLGTGGVGFILWNLDGPGPGGPGPGHIVKLRYTPWQTEVMAAEAPESPHHASLAGARSLDALPVVVCGLHSQIAGVAAGIKAAAPDARVGYLMTDGAALPIAWSRLVRDLVDRGLIDITVTTGHAFGGDLETINVFSGLLAARHAGSVDVVVAAMGPGVVGTGTAMGFTAMEQGQVLDAAGALGGRPIASLRICFSDERARHHGLSHHSTTALTTAAARRATVAVPELPDEQASAVSKRLRESGVAELHEVVVSDGGPGVELLVARRLKVRSMGREMAEIPELFLAAAAAGRIAME